MSSPDPSQDSFAFDQDDDQWDPYDDFSQQPTQTNELKFCQLSDWDSEKTYDESYISYTIEWKMTVNNRAKTPKHTEQNIALALAAYWQHFLQPKLEGSVRRQNRSLKSDFTSVVVSVTQRKEPDLTKVFDKTNIDWAVIERQLLTWSELYRAGKKFRVNLSFNYVDSSHSSTTSLGRVDKRGASSTTQQMLAEGAAQLDAEYTSTGHRPIWRDVYNLMRCPGSPCHLGPHCWVDPVGKKHYKLNSHHLKSLIMHVQDGHTLETHDDVPQKIRDELYAEEQQSLKRHQKTTRTSIASHPPITITNVLPTPSYQLVSSATGTPAPDMTPIEPLGVPGFLDEQVEDYCTWQKSRVKRPNLKEEFQKAYDVIIEEGMDLELIRRSRNTKFLTDRGVKRGTAERVVGDVDRWVETTKRARTEES
jgi:hypothetical protein